MSHADILRARAMNVEPSPFVVSPLSPELRRGLIALMSCSLLSVITTSCLLVFLTQRFIFWRRYYNHYPGYNQCVVLIFNLLLADLQQSSSFLVTPYWLLTDQLSAHSSACFAQGWLINLGDVASGMFVLAIAAHTFAVVVGRRMLGYKTFIGCLVGLWIFCVTITLIAPAAHGKEVFVPSGGWCWIDRKYEQERLYLHYLWIFISEFGSVAIYVALFVILRKRINDMSLGLGDSRTRQTDASAQKFGKVIRYMLLYPIAYIILSLPIAAGRMSLMNGRDPGANYFYASGCMIMCSGWVDSIIYFTTRRRLIEADIQTNSESSGRRYPYPWDGGTSRVEAETVGGTQRSRTKQDGDMAVSQGRWNIVSGSESTDNIMECVEFSDLSHVHQKTVIEITSEPAEAGASSKSSSLASSPTINGSGTRSKFPRPKK